MDVEGLAVRGNTRVPARKPGHQQLLRPGKSPSNNEVGVLLVGLEGNPGP